MKYLPHIGFPLLMIILLAGAFILPKFTRISDEEGNDEIPNVEDLSYEEMKTLLAESGVEVETPLLDSQNAAESPEPDPESKPEADSQTNTELTPEPPQESAPKMATSEPSSDPLPAPALEEDLEPFFAAIEAGKINEARETLTGLKDSIPKGMLAGLETTLATTEKAQTQLAAKQAELDRTSEALETQRTKVSEIQEASLRKIETSVKNLEAATKAAEKAASEASTLRKEISEARTAQAAAPVKGPASVQMKTEPEPLPAPIAKADLPETKSIQFGLDSSYLSADSKKTIQEASEELKKEARLKVQLRGYADKRGDAEYNAILSRARAESVSDALISAGIGEDRIEVISFGESQSSGAEDSPSLRRVDILFRSK